jgi:hypothetical protein
VPNHATIAKNTILINLGIKFNLYKMTCFLSWLRNTVWFAKLWTMKNGTEGCLMYTKSYKVLKILYLMKFLSINRAIYVWRFKSLTTLNTPQFQCWPAKKSLGCSGWESSEYPEQKRELINKNSPNKTLLPGCFKK